MLVTDEMLIENSKRINNEERKKVKIHIKELNGEIECELLNKEDYLDLILSKEKDKDLEIIYNSCPIFRDDKLIDSLNCRSKPTQVVAKVLKDPTVYKLADFILTASGYGETDLVSLVEETKN